MTPEQQLIANYQAAKIALAQAKAAFEATETALMEYQAPQPQDTPQPPAE